ncbi:hypothetical protein C9925_00850 [cyanobacterium G8-9]|nr:hypothetical protein C9925_00850 [cyanobacterium G8-9]
MKSDTIALKISLSFYDTIKVLEGIFAKKAIVTRLNGQQLQYQKKSVTYVRSSAQIQLSEYAYITITQYKTHSDSGIYHTFIELHGLKQFNTNGTPIALDIERNLEELISTLTPTLWRIEMPYDILIPFDEVAPYFENYFKPYATTYESHSKKSTVTTQYQLYCKTSKDDLEVNITRLEMKRDYSRKRTPIALTTIEELKEIEEELHTMTKEEFEKNAPNVHTPLTTPHHTVNTTVYLTDQNTLNEVEAINILHEDIEALSHTADEVRIHTAKGIITYKDNTLFFSPPLMPVALKLLEKTPTVKEMIENST